MNLKSDPQAVMDALIALGDYEPGNPRFIHDGQYSLPEAIAAVQKSDFEGALIYGFSGVARYIVKGDGTVYLDGKSCPDKIERALELGLGIC